jgi:hypothetical protein
MFLRKCLFDGRFSRRSYRQIIKISITVFVAQDPAMYVRPLHEVVPRSTTTCVARVFVNAFLPSA